MSLRRGDPWPPITAAGAGRIEVNLSHQSRAGRTTILGFVNPETLDTALAAYKSAIPETEQNIVCTLIIEGHPPTDGKTSYPLEAVWFADSIAPKLIGQPSGWALVDRSGRLQDAAPLEQLPALYTQALQLEEACESKFAPVLLLDNVLEPELCGKLLSYWEREPKIENAVAANRAGNATANDEIKRRSDVLLKHKGLLEEVTERVNTRVLPDIYNFMRTRIVDSEAFRIGCYESGNLGGFGRHRDNTTKHTNHRAFAMSMNLNDPASYEGGAVIFPEFGDRQYRPNAGGCVVFSCGMLHEALPVTAGRRFGMFTFMVDQSGLKTITDRRAAKR